MGSFLSQLLSAFAGGLAGKSPPTHPDQQPVHAAVDAMSQAASALGQSVQTAMRGGIDQILDEKIGPAGDEVVDLAIDEGIAYLQSKRSTPKAA